MDWLYKLASEPFYELAFILVLAALLGALGKFMKQPLIAQEKEMDLLQQIIEEQVLMPQRMAAENFFNTYLSKIFQTITT
jgi:hypothetical protein